MLLHMDERFPTRRHRADCPLLQSFDMIVLALHRKFTCVAAYFFVRQDSRTSVALCTACPPNRMSISLRFSSFQLIVHAELCLAFLYQYYSTPFTHTHNTARRNLLSPSRLAERSSEARSRIWSNSGRSTTSASTNAATLGSIALSVLVANLFDVRLPPLFIYQLS